MDCFCALPWNAKRPYGVSISALSDRGLLQRKLLPICGKCFVFQYPLFRIVDCFLHVYRSVLFLKWGFNIRSFGSWIASKLRFLLRNYGLIRFNIRSFGSWIASSFPFILSTPTLAVSISALSDRGLLRRPQHESACATLRFNIRSFGSWIASMAALCTPPVMAMFQYPLFRIVDCFRASGYYEAHAPAFQYPLFRIVDCFIAFCDVLAKDGSCFNIRSFGSWIASSSSRI